MGVWTDWFDGVKLGEVNPEVLENLSKKMRTHYMGLALSKSKDTRQGPSAEDINAMLTRLVTCVYLQPELAEKGLRVLDCLAEACMDPKLCLYNPYQKALEVITNKALYLAVLQIVCQKAGESRYPKNCTDFVLRHGSEVSYKDVMLYYSDMVGLLSRARKKTGTGYDKMPAELKRAVESGEISEFDAKRIVLQKKGERGS